MCVWAPLGNENPFQRENSLLKKTLARKGMGTFGTHKEWTKMEKCPKTDYTPEPEQDFPQLL